MTLLKWPSEVAQMLVDDLKAGAATLGIAEQDVYYGDRTNIIDFPAIAVEVFDRPVVVRFTRRTEVKFAAYVMAYFARYEDNETLRKAADEFSEKVVEYLNRDPQWKDVSDEQRLIWGWVTRLEPGYAKRGSVVYAARITWEAGSQAPL